MTTEISDLRGCSVGTTSENPLGPSISVELFLRLTLEVNQVLSRELSPVDSIRSCASELVCLFVVHTQDVPEADTHTTTLKHGDTLVKIAKEIVVGNRTSVSRCVVVQTPSLEVLDDAVD